MSQPTPLVDIESIYFRFADVVSDAQQVGYARPILDTNFALTQMPTTGENLAKKSIVATDKMIDQLRSDF